MHKAFLCHSSEDKAYVDLVAQRLGRARLAYDSLHFAPHTSLTAQVQRHVGSSAVFCFFVSKKSLLSTWCTMEVDLARIKAEMGQLSSHLTIIIDSTVAIDDVPKWLRRALVRFHSRPVVAAREIQQALYETSPTDLVQPFVGRTGEIQELSRKAAHLPTPCSSFIIATGLSGIGRQTLVARFGKEVLGLLPGPVFHWDNASDLEEFYLWLLDEADQLEDKAKLKTATETFHGLDEHGRAECIADVLRSLSSEGSLPIVVESGGLLREQGRVRDDFAAVLESAATTNAHVVHLSIVARRRVVHLPEEIQERSLSVHVSPLGDEHMLLLVRQLLRRSRLDATREQEAAIVTATGGYPPAAYFICEHARLYGIDVTTADTSLLEDFKEMRFGHFLKELQLGPPEIALLKYLAREKGLPLGPLAVAMATAEMVLATMVKSLVDRSLLVSADGRIALASPISTAVHRVFGEHSEMFYEGVLKRMLEVYWRNPLEIPSLDIVDASLNAAAKSGGKDVRELSDVMRPAPLFRIAAEHYHQKRWNEALAYLANARKLGGSEWTMIDIELKALSQLERWEDAEDLLRRMDARGYADVHVLRGFCRKKQWRHEDAIASYRKALAIGQRGVAVLRDLADCLWRVGKFEEARGFIEEAFERDSENAFVVDLCVRIALDSGDVASAERWMRVLEHVDGERRFVHHRRATILAKRGEIERALVEAEQAIGIGAAPIEAYATRADVLIEMQRFEEARRAIDELGARWAGQRVDVQRGLRVKLLARQGLWRDAYGVWLQLERKGLPVNQALLKLILELKADDPDVDAKDRDAARKQAGELRPGRSGFIGSHSDEFET